MREIECTVPSQEGRKVYVIERITMRQIREVARLESQTRGDWDDEAFENLYKAYAELVPHWDFTDGNGTPLPQPEDDHWAFDELNIAELGWLTETVFGSLVKPPPPKG